MTKTKSNRITAERISKMRLIDGGDVQNKHCPARILLESESRNWFIVLYADLDVKAGMEITVESFKTISVCKRRWKAMADQSCIESPFRMKSSRAAPMYVIPVAIVRPEYDAAWANCPDCGDERRVAFELKPFKVPEVKCKCGAIYDLTGF